MTTPYIRAEYSNSDAGSIEFMIEKMLTGKVFIELACVNACDPAVQTVDVIPLVNRTDPEGKPITHGTVYSGSNSVSLKDLRDHFNRHRHDVQGVESGGSRVTSAPPDNPTE
ncbi:hypothetical protein SGGMMB4_03030 [Sodalis glossinidius str. 'morsitans']|uniref:Uncharacterized protein n=1 Tax=Sodalis glossinidius (strain morsitans) TaxID=343509 RepID=A0A193QJM5_SODGM|nr:hypothetical protein [Sodalis glossinidius]CRL45366.1 hypothetical protein SGGMMB4_03030 [Sodalis glossinidius str. 'morsitans']